MKIDMKIDGQPVTLTEREARILRALFGNRRPQMNSAEDGGFSVHWRAERGGDRLTVKWDSYQIA